MPNKKTGLGRGLSSLIPIAVAEIEEKTISTPKRNSTDSNNGVLEIEVEKIKANPHQPRQFFDQEQLDDLAASIKEHGILQPLVVSETEDGYELLAGERRLKASKLIGLKTVPVVVRSVTDQEKLELALIENIQRHNLNPLEEAAAYRKLIEEFNLIQDQVAKRVGKKRATVSNTLRLLTLPEAAQEALLSNRITAGHAKALMGLKSGKEQLRMLDKILNFGLSVRDVESNVKKISNNKPKRIIQKSPELNDYEGKLQSKLGTKVNIRQKGKGGEVVVEFYDSKDLSDLVERIL